MIENRTTGGAPSSDLFPFQESKIGCNTYSVIGEYVLNYIQLKTNISTRGQCTVVTVPLYS